MWLVVARSTRWPKNHCRSFKRWWYLGSPPRFVKFHDFEIYWRLFTAHHISALQTCLCESILRALLNTTRSVDQKLHRKRRFMFIPKSLTQAQNTKILVLRQQLQAISRLDTCKKAISVQKCARRSWTGWILYKRLYGKTLIHPHRLGG